MKYKITLNGKTYEVEVEAGQAMLVDEYEAYAPAPAAAPADAARTARHNNVLSCEIHTYFPFRFCIVFIVFVFNFSFLNL